MSSRLCPQQGSGLVENIWQEGGSRTVPGKGSRTGGRGTWDRREPSGLSEAAAEKIGNEVIAVWCASRTL